MHTIIPCIHISILFILALIDPMLIIYAYETASLCVWATGVFNTWGHGKGLKWLGYRTWDTNDESVNPLSKLNNIWRRLAQQPNKLVLGIKEESIGGSGT